MLETSQLTDDGPPKPLFVDKRALLPLMEQINEELGLTPGPAPTPREAREMMAVEGIRPEDNVFSRAIIAARYPNEDTNAEGWE